MSAITLTKDNFQSEVLSSEVPALIDFWAPWCMPCRMVGPVIAQIAKLNTNDESCTTHFVQNHCSLVELEFAFDLIYKLARENY